MELAQLLQSENPHLTDGEAAFIADRMTPNELRLLSNELLCRKEDDLKLCLIDLQDVDDIRPAKVSWYGIDLFQLSVLDDSDPTDDTHDAHDTYDSDSD